MIMLFILIATFFIINNKFNFIKQKGSANDSNKRRIIWLNKEDIINGIKLSISYIDFMGYNFRISLTKTKDKTNKYYVSFRKNNFNKINIFNFKNLKEKTIAFEDYESACNYYDKLKKDVSSSLNQDNQFIAFSKINPVFIDC